MTDNENETTTPEIEAKPPKKKKGGKSTLITGLVILGIIVILCAGGAGYFSYINNAPLPKINGNVRVSGLYDKVEVIRDSNGIPHIYASNMHDLNFAQGYIQAQDRWWQMEMFRHICGGRIEELTGKKTSLIPTDIYLRTLGWYKVAEKEYASYTPEQLAPLDAFAAGVNAYISTRSPRDLSVNYSILGLTGVKFEIEPWTPVDTLAFGKLMCYDLGYSTDEEIQRSKLYSALGQEMADKWQTPPWGYGEKPTIINDADVKVMDSSTAPAASSNSTSSTTGQPVSSIQAYDDPRPDLSWVMGPSAGIGSNNWVVSGNLTQSGKPLLANDPHLGIQMPSIWYEIGLHCPDDGKGQPYDVVGFAFAPSPGVIIGHNNNIAWGVTNVYPDVHDHYQIKVNPDNPFQYEWNGEWRDMTVRNETVDFGDGSSPITIKVRETHLGPIINDNKYDAKTGQFFGLNNKDPLALRWTALDPGTLVSAIYGIDTASNWNEFRNALRNWDCPSQNFIYADNQGNIGYQMPSKVPIRDKNHSGLLPVPGWTDEFEWKGYIPFDLLPRAYNPERGYIITANQAVVPLSYYDFLKKHLDPNLNYNLGYEWNFGYRGQRIEQLIKALAPHSIETFQQIQGDNMVLSVGEVTPYLANVKFEDPALKDAKNWMAHWDQNFNVDSPQAALYAEFWMRLVNNTVQDQLGDIIKSEGDDRDMWAISQLLKNPDDPWWDDVLTKDIKETRDEILARSFKEGYEATVAALGPDRSQWKWGDLHTATFVSNPLGASGIAPLESLVNRGPYPAGGSTDAVNACRWTVDSGNFKISSIPSMRMIIDWNDLSKSVTVNNTGQSGNPASKWYDSMIKPWLNIKYHTMLWTKDQVNSNAAQKLVLTP
ncbi:MAG: penicillin acylase family protein [Dehalococcoidia bacterium]